MARHNVSKIESGAGFFMGFANAIMDVVREKSYPFEAIYRLVTPGGRTTLAKIVDLAHTDWQAEQSKPIEQPEGGHPFSGDASKPRVKFVAQVVYAIPAMDELKRRFPANVNPTYANISFEPIKVCENVSRETREVTFELIHLGYAASNYGVLAEIKRLGLRPALPEELLAFDAEYPEEMMKFPITALGSRVSVSGYCCVAVLYPDDDGRCLFLNSINSGWDGEFRSLAVRK